MNDDQFLLANAYHDGELTAAERALAEADPAVMAAVDELRALAVELCDVEPPAPDVREAAVAAAMAEFHRIRTPAAEPVTNATVPSRRRPSMSRWLAVAAAVVGVGLLGVIITQGTGGGGDDDAASMQATGGSAGSESRLAQSDAAEQTTAAMATLPDDDDPAADAASDVASAAPSAPSAEVMAADDMTAAGAAPARPALVAGQTLTSPEELGSYGTGLLEQRADGKLPPTPETACAQGGILSTTTYLLDGTATDVLIAVDEQRGTVSAIDPSTCALLVEGPLF